MQSVQETRKRKKREEQGNFNFFEISNGIQIEYLDKWRGYKNVNNVDLIHLLKENGKIFFTKEEFYFFFSILKYNGMKSSNCYITEERMNRLIMINEFFEFHSIDMYIDNQFKIPLQDNLFNV